MSKYIETLFNLCVIKQLNWWPGEVRPNAQSAETHWAYQPQLLTPGWVTTLKFWQNILASHTHKHTRVTLPQT